MLNVEWIKCGDGTSWCAFEIVTLDKVKTEGVYVIWHDGNPGRFVYVGQGDIAARLKAHRSDTRITSYAKSGTLRVTWAAVPAAQRDGVERYLASGVADAIPAKIASQVSRSFMY